MAYLSYRTIYDFTARNSAASQNNIASPTSDSKSMTDYTV